MSERAGTLSRYRTLIGSHCALCCTGGTLEYCAHNAEVYSVGESWLVDECTQCTCVDGAQVLCSVTVCEVSTSAECSSSPVDQLCCHVCHSQSTCRPRRRFTFCSKLNVKFAFETHTYTHPSVRTGFFGGSVCSNKARFDRLEFIKACTHAHPFNGPFSGTTRVSRYQKVKPIWILLKQETVSGSGISWAYASLHFAPYR